MTTIYLDFKKYMNEVDRKDFLHRYEVRLTSDVGFEDELSQPYKMLKGTPIMINIGGHLVNVLELEYLATNKYSVVRDYMRGVISADLSATPFVKFRWTNKKGNNEQ